MREDELKALYDELVGVAKFSVMRALLDVADNNGSRWSEDLADTCYSMTEQEAEGLAQVFVEDPVGDMLVYFTDELRHLIRKYTHKPVEVVEREGFTIGDHMAVDGSVEVRYYTIAGPGVYTKSSAGLQHCLDVLRAQPDLTVLPNRNGIYQAYVSCSLIQRPSLDALRSYIGGILVEAGIQPLQTSIVLQFGGEPYE